MRSTSTLMLRSVAHQLSILQFSIVNTTGLASTVVVTTELWKKLYDATQKDTGCASAEKRCSCQLHLAVMKFLRLAAMAKPAPRAQRALRAS